MSVIAYRNVESGLDHESGDVRLEAVERFVELLQGCEDSLIDDECGVALRRGGG